METGKTSNCLSLGQATLASDAATKDRIRHHATVPSILFVLRIRVTALPSELSLLALKVETGKTHVQIVTGAWKHGTGV